MIYLHRGTARTVCETEASAQRLEARGWVRCSSAIHRALWRIADYAALSAIQDQPAQWSEVAEAAQQQGGCHGQTADRH